ncbi:ElyC/SanA/YdcF family protein [Methylocaldum sp.]|uniref:ElyC/SanA/YdcF family protein n=1 Tax=Methylocaldum sp. TaxID=1969727 RepID=UPI002D2AE11E|nr:ElyC/SanA/YdcF family protein [Methylocaldum sp.]HYE36640.1 ElyC/SanA/YdcF family protein [Methylocaldum sp.]
MPDYAMEEVISEFKRNHYSKIYVTGGPIERGAPLHEYRTSAEAGAATLIRLGLNADVVRAVPAPLIRKDRTYIAAVALKNWLLQHEIAESSLTVISLGVHARRSRVLFQEAMGRSTRIGVIAIEDRSYDSNRWWESSQGFRTVTDEIIAYAYVRLLFQPRKERV